jgi:uncharacterized phage protein (TIGR01671 family)
MRVCRGYRGGDTDLYCAAADMGGAVMREIKFRGKRRRMPYCGQWAYGGAYQRHGGEWAIISKTIDYAVVEKTVGQYTGLTDKNGTEIYEGDIVRVADWRHPMTIKFGKVGYDTEWNGLTGFYYAEAMHGEFMNIEFENKPDSLEVIGNIHEVTNDGH